MLNRVPRSARVAVGAVVVLAVVVFGVAYLRDAERPAGQPAGTTQSGGKYIYSAIPDDAIAGFIKQINAGEYGKAAAYYWQAPDYWQGDPQLWKTMIERVTGGNQIDRYEPLPSLSVQKADTASLTGYIHQKDGKRQVLIDVVRKPEGWIIVGFQ